MGDLLITVHSDSPPVVLGLNPASRTYYLHSTALVGSELGDIVVLPSAPQESLVIGDVENGGIGIQRLDACGNRVSPTFGTFPDQLAPPLPPIQKGAFNNRGLVFSPVSGMIVSPGLETLLLDGSMNVGVLFTFPMTGGIASPLVSTGNLIDASLAGGVAADELGTVYLGRSYYGSGMSATNIETFPPVQASLPGVSFTNSIRDAVSDGNGHVFITDVTNSHGMVWRVNAASGASHVWTTNMGPAFGNSPFNDLFGITIDASGDLWVVEVYGANTARGGVVHIDGRTGDVRDYFQAPDLVDGRPAAQAGLQGIAVLGVNLPAVREICRSDCAAGQITDCNGKCVAASQRGDLLCDDGPAVNLNCYPRGFDFGDCNPCAPNEVPDCNGACGPKGWIGDGICDDGGWEYMGHPVTYDCAAFRYDEATCRGCGSGETLDCNGNCSPIGWLGDSICDDGGFEYKGHPVTYDCIEYDFDQHQCHHG